MPVLSANELRGVLDNQTFDQLLGTRESSWLEFKSQPYQLATDFGAWELAKDVAAFANASGGVIVVGVRTVKQEGINVDVATELRPMPPGLSNQQRHMHVINAGMFPVPDGVVLSTSTVDGDKQLLVIEVPAQPEHSKPFLVRYLVDKDDRRLAGFGWPVRTGDIVTWQSCERFQSLLSLEGAVRRLFAAGDQTGPRPPLTLPPDSGARASAIRERIDSSAAALILQASPRHPVELTDIMYGDHGIAGALRRLRPLRDRGFNLTPGLDTDVRGPLGIEYGGRWRTAIDHTGLVTLVIPTDTNSLGWAMDQRGDKNAINSVVLAELVNGFFRILYDVVLAESKVPHESWIVGIRAVEMMSKQVKLAKGWPRYIHDDEIERARSDEFERTIALSGNQDADTCSALSIFYALFGLAPEDVPFCRDKSFSPSEFLESTKSLR